MALPPLRRPRRWRPSELLIFGNPKAGTRTPKNKEGEIDQRNREWNKENGSYRFSRGLGVVIMAIGVFIGSYPINPGVSAVGSLLVIFMSFTTLSFLVTTPEALVPALGDGEHGFPYLSIAGRVQMKDTIMPGASVVTPRGAAKSALNR